MADEAWVKHMEATLLDAVLPSARRALGRAVAGMVPPSAGVPAADEFTSARGPTEVWEQYRRATSGADRVATWWRPETRDEVYLRVWAELLMLWRVFAANRGPDGDATLYATAHEQLSLVMASMMLGSPESTLAWLAEDPANEFSLADRLAPRRLFAKIEQPEQAGVFGPLVTEQPATKDAYHAEWIAAPTPSEDDAYERAMRAREREVRDAALREMVAEHARLASEHDKLRVFASYRAHLEYMGTRLLESPMAKNPIELKAAPSSFVLTSPSVFVLTSPIVSGDDYRFAGGVPTLTAD